MFLQFWLLSSARKIGLMKNCIDGARRISTCSTEDFVEFYVLFGMARPTRTRKEYKTNNRLF